MRGSRALLLAGFESSSESCRATEFKVPYQVMPSLHLILSPPYNVFSYS